MATLTRTVTINAPVEDVYNLVLDIGKFWHWPDVALTEIELTPEGVGSTARMYGHVMAIHVEGSITYTDVTPHDEVVAKVGFGPEHPIWTFTFEPEAGGTKLTAKGEWHVNIPAVGKRIEGLMVKEHEEGLQALLDNAKAQLEGAKA